MTEERVPPVDVPTLTEVVGFGDAAPRPIPTLVDVESLRSTASQTSELSEPTNVEELIAQRILPDLQRQVDLMFEYRLREALAPLLTRLADSLVREVRDELSTTLRDVVKRAVAQELARQRTR